MAYAVMMVGSNHPMRQQLVEETLEMLTTWLADASVSSVVFSPDSRGGSTVYANAVIAGITDLDVDELQTLAKSAEHNMGRRRSHDDPIVMLDVDLLIYDHTELKPDDLHTNHYRACASTLHPII